MYLLFFGSIVVVHRQNLLAAGQKSVRDTDSEGPDLTYYTVVTMMKQD